MAIWKKRAPEKGAPLAIVKSLENFNRILISFIEVLCFNIENHLKRVRTQGGSAFEATKVNRNRKNRDDGRWIDGYRNQGLLLGVNKLKIVTTKTKIFLTLAIVMVLSLSVSTALAYTYGGYYWEDKETTYDLSALPGTWQTQVVNGATTWNGAGADFTFIPASSSSPNDITQEYMDDDDIVGQAGGTASGSLFLTAWMKFNTKHSFSTTGSSGTYDIWSVAEHELGHWLRLNHTGWKWPPQRVMYPTIGTGMTRRNLQQDDIDGIIYIYGEE